MTKKKPIKSEADKIAESRKRTIRRLEKSPMNLPSMAETAAVHKEADENLGRTWQCCCAACLSVRSRKSQTKKPIKQRRRLNFTTSPEIDAAVEAYCNENGVEFSVWVRRLICEAIGKPELANTVPRKGWVPGKPRS